MKIALGIVAHTTRAAMADSLAVRVDPDYISTDDGTLGCEGNHLKVWNHLSHTDADWAVALEDDAIPVDGLRGQLAMALAVAPTPIVSLYLGTSHQDWNQHHRVRPVIRQAGAACWLQHHRLLHAVAVAIRIDHLPMQLDTDGIAIDDAISNWAMARGHSVAYTLPSLVDHADTEPVITRRHDSHPRNAPRKAIRVGARAVWDATAHRF